eukprot:gene1448-435_t
MEFPPISQIVNQQLYRVDNAAPQGRTKNKHGVLDPRLGVCAAGDGPCDTCGLTVYECPGHFGSLQLSLPVFHTGFLKGIHSCLKTVCKVSLTMRCYVIPHAPQTCRSPTPSPGAGAAVWVLLPLDKRGPMLSKMQSATESRQTVVKQVLKECAKVKACPHCGAVNGQVKKLGSPPQFVHEVFKVKKQEGAKSQFLANLKEVISANPEIKQVVNRTQEVLTPLVALQLFRRIKPEDLPLLGMQASSGKPEDLIITNIPVPPVCIRPTVPSQLGSGTTEDDLSMKLVEIIECSESISSHMEDGMQTYIIMDLWQYLQTLCATYLDSSSPSFAQHKLRKPVRSLVQRLKGKGGRFRANLSGKRVDFSARTVISPDPNVEITEVVVPEDIAKRLTYPDRVTSNNIEELRKPVRNGPDVYPGAVYHSPSADSKLLKRDLRYIDRQNVANTLRIGDVIDRHLIDGDLVLFNRQPSLHRISIMCHRVRVLPGRTFRFNECVCAPYNADFDGDEMNLHVPQTEEARAEAMVLMDVAENIVTPKNGEPIVAATQDFLTASYLMTRRCMFMDRTTFCQCVAMMGLGDQQFDLPPPTIWKPAELWTGKQVYSVLVHPVQKDTRPRVDLEVITKSYDKDGGQTHMCKQDGFVSFHGGDLISGTLEKKTLGAGCKDGLFFGLRVKAGNQYAGQCMARVARLTSRWLMNYGFSIGIGDVMPSTALTEKKKRLIDSGYSECLEYIRQFHAGDLDAAPGCTEEQTVESLCSKRLSDIREKAGAMCIGELPNVNAPLIMALSGSKGSNINISQMVACVGQQTVGGKRIPNGFISRTLPHFQRHTRLPAARGFVVNSFFTGLSPTEFFFHTMGGREGLVDTAVKTADTGYMQRRLIKSLEDLVVQYDDTVRNAQNCIMQFRYGEDGLDPAFMEGEGPAEPINLAYLWKNVQRDNSLSSGAALLPYQIVDEVCASLVPHQTEDEPCMGALARVFSDKFCDRYQAFWQGVCDQLASIRRNVRLPVHDRAPAAGQNPVLGDASVEARCHGFLKVTATQVNGFLKTCHNRLNQYRMQPGTASGAIAAQSIGEPGTQMTLKTFHFAGVASMNVTLGVPRIQEIINASKKISTPIITAGLLRNPQGTKLPPFQDLKSVRIVKGRVEHTFLGEVCVAISEVIKPGQVYVSVQLDLKTIEDLQLDVTVYTVKDSILASTEPKLHLTSDQVKVTSSNHLSITITSALRTGIRGMSHKTEDLTFALHNLRLNLEKVVVKGIPTIQRAVINILEKSDPGFSRDAKEGEQYNLLVEGRPTDKAEGTDFLRVMTTPGVDSSRTTTNHIIATEKILGIEAARASIISEIQNVMSKHSLSVDVRHLMTLADVMTCKGIVVGINRFGLQKMKDNVMMLASFERTSDHLFDAGVYGNRDKSFGVTESIILGSPIPAGTNTFSLLQ